MAAATSAAAASAGDKKEASVAQLAQGLVARFQTEEDRNKCKRDLYLARVEADHKRLEAELKRVLSTVRGEREMTSDLQTVDRWQLKFCRLSCNATANGC